MFRFRWRPNAEYSAGSIAATIQSIVYGGATGGLFSLLQSAGFFFFFFFDSHLYPGSYYKRYTKDCPSTTCARGQRPAGFYTHTVKLYVQWEESASRLDLRGIGA